MVRVFYSQKTERLIGRMELSHWRQLVRGDIDQRHRDMSDHWKMCAVGERVRLEGRDLGSVRDLSPEAIQLGYDFSVAMQERDGHKALEIITKIENLETIWRSEK